MRPYRAGSLRMKLRFPARRDTLGKGAVAGLVLGVESVPDGLAAGLLAGVRPLSGLYAYMFGTIGGSLFTSSTFMAVQATSAMSIIVADVPAVHSAGDQERALFTRSVLTGVSTLAAGTGSPGTRAGPRAGDPGAVAGLRGTGPGSGHLRCLPQPGRGRQRRIGRASCRE